jgi:hypothetical protein
MATLFANARDWLADQMQAAAGVSVSYARAAGGAAISLTPWVGRSGFTAEVEGGAYVQWGDRDYLIQRSDLTVSGSEVEPALGDRLTETINGVSHVFEVQTPKSGEPVAGWRWSDQSRSVYRLHVKRVS